MATAGAVGRSMRKTAKRWAVSSMLSSTSSIEVASAWMSSRSNGVMKLRSSAWMMRSTISSQAVFQGFISLLRAARSLNSVTRSGTWPRPGS